MPFYDFKCPHCNHSWEDWFSTIPLYESKQDEERKCDLCGHTLTLKESKLFNTKPVVVLFGEGFGTPSINNMEGAIKHNNEKKGRGGA